ncbi:MAG: hypothetical protein ACFFBP_11310 [Promethearchaeota archaeon]
MEVFLKRAEGSFKAKIGDEKALEILGNIKKSTNEIPIKFRRNIGSEIPKVLFNYSQEIDSVSPEIVENVLIHVLMFAESLKDLKNKEKREVDQILSKRSNNEMRTLSDLLSKYIEQANLGKNIEGEVSFDAILTYMFGGKEEVTQMSDVGLFIKRAKDNFALKFGEAKAEEYALQINQSLNQIDADHQDYINSEISKYLFKFSQHIEEFSEGTFESILNNILLFLNSCSDIGKSKDEISQEIFRRSKNKVRTIVELLVELIEAVKEGNLMESSENLDSILTHLYGEEEVRQQFSDVEAFLKRSEKKYVMILGGDMIQMLIEELLDAISAIPEEHREYLGSELAKYIFKSSETATIHNPEKIELMFNGAIMFAYSLAEIEGLSKAEINQFIINRSSHKVRSLFDLYLAFLEKIAVRMPLANEPTFDEILNHTLGRYTGPKEIEKAGLIHDLMADYHEEIPLAKEHASWANGIMAIIPRYLELLPNGKGDRIMDQLWEQKFPQEQIKEDFREKIAEIPREHEKQFLFRLLHFLTQQVLENEEDDKALTSALAFRILGTIFIEMFSGRNPQIRGIRLNKLLKEREISNPEHKKEIDHDINIILDEDMKSLMQRTMTINTIIPIINKKGFFIKIYDIVTKDMPKPIIKLITERKEERIKDIGQEYKKESVSGELIPLVNHFLGELELGKRFYKKYFEEMYSIAHDAQQNMLSIRKFFKLMVDLNDNMDAIEYYNFKIANTEHIVYIAILKYLYNALWDTNISDILNTIKTILNEQEYQTKIMTLDKYLSNQKLEELKDEIKHTEEKIAEYEKMPEFDTTQKIVNLNKALQRDTNELKYYTILFRLLVDSQKVEVILRSRIEFSKKLLSYSNSLRKIHPNLPAALPDYLDKFNEFPQEINKILEELKKKTGTGIISPFEFKERNDAADDAKKELSILCENQEFVDHLNTMLEISNIDIFEN